MKIDQIVHDERIYPRKEINYKKVGEYKDALLGGAEFPPIIITEYGCECGHVVQSHINKEACQEPECKCKNYTGRNIIIDGVHRFKAYEGSAAKEIPAEILSVPADGWTIIALFEEAVRRNATHGFQLTPSEKEVAAQKIFKLDPVGFRLEIASKILGVSIETVRKSVKDLMDERDKDHRLQALILNRLGWNEIDIGPKIGKAEGWFNDEKRKIQELEKSVHDEDRSVEKLAEKHELPVPVIEGIKYEGLADLERMEKLKIGLRPYTVWNFSSCDARYGVEYPGRIPGELVANLIYFFTVPGARIIDPMAGGGVVLDVALAMNRKCLAFDVNPYAPKDAKGNPRPKLGIIQHDCREPFGISEKQRADLVFIDPPYFKKKEEQYGPEAISALNKKDYLDAFRKIALNLYEITKNKGKLALLMSNFMPDAKNKDMILITEYIAIFEAAGYKLIQWIDCPLSTELIQPTVITSYKETKKLYNLTRQLVVFEK